MRWPWLLSDWYLLSRTFLYIVKRLHRETMVHFAPRMGGNLLDLGCGLRPYRSLFQCSSYVGIDLDTGRRPDLVADVQHVPLASGLMDSVLCLETLEHVSDPVRVVDEMHRILKPNGLVLVTAPMSWNLHYEPFDFRRFTKYGLWQLLEGSHFHILETRRIGGLFSLVGSRLVDSIALEFWRRLAWIPPKIRHGLILCYSIPVSLFFLLLAKIGDGFEQSDAIGWAVLAQKDLAT